MRFVFFCVLILVSSVSFAHSRLKASTAIKIRSTDPGIKTGPCGGYAKAQPAVLSSGQAITVEWEETIYHPGRFEFYFSPANDQNFTLLKTVQQDPANNSSNAPHQFSTSITLPNVACDNCTIQMIQVMLENPNNPTYYYSCSDVQLKSGTGPTPSPTPTPANCP